MIVIARLLDFYEMELKIAEEARGSQEEILAA